MKDFQFALWIAIVVVLVELRVITWVRHRFMNDQRRPESDAGFCVLPRPSQSQRRLLRIFMVPGLLVFSCVYFFAATNSLVLVKYGILLAGLLMNGPFSFWGNYLPRMYPTYLRGTGESFAINIGARVIGASGVLLTTQLANIMPGANAAARHAYSAGALAVLAYAGSLIGSFWLREPASAQLPE